MTIEFSRQIFEKSSISNFIKIRPVGSDLFMRSPRLDEANSRFSQVLERA